MARKKKNEVTSSAVKIQGFCRVQLKEDGKVVGDSGWSAPNLVTNVGVQNILSLIGASAGSFQIAAMAVGTGAYPASDATSLANEYGGTAKRCVVTAATSNRGAVNGTATLQFAGSWSSTLNGTASTIQNIGLFNVSTAQGSMLAGNTYATSQWNTNQDLYASYQIRMSFGT